MPEKSLNAVSDYWRELYEKGLDALHRQNLDYALTIFTQVLEKEPGFYECREALRATQFKKAEAGTSFFKKAFGAASTGPLLAKGQIALRSNPLEAIQIAEQILTQDPRSMMAHKLLAEAALAADLPRTALLSLEIVYKNSSGDRAVALRMAEAAGKSGQVERAEEILGQFAAANPGDSEIAQALKDLSARRTMVEGGYSGLEDGQGSYRDILKDKDQAKALEQENREVKSDDVAVNLIAEYEARLPREPNNMRLLRSLAELYCQKQDYDKSLEYYQRILDVGSGGDASLEKSMTDVRVKKFDLELSRLDPAAPDYAEKSAQIQAQQQAMRIAECKARCDRYPTDLQIRFELGQLYFDAGKIGEAIQEFQKAQANPHRRIQSLYYLGQCFAHRKMYDLAARSLQNAIKEKLPFDDEKKELIYALGCVFEKMKKAEEAIEQFKLIYEVDIAYKDVSAKVDAYYAAQG